MRLVPLSDHVVLKKMVEEETTASGIVLPDQGDREKSGQGEIIAVGPGRLVDGKEVKMQVKIGDKVLCSGYVGSDAELDSVKYVVIKRSDILVVIEQENGQEKSGIMIKEVKFGVKARDALIQGVNELANAIRVTTGSKGRSVVLDKSYSAPLITNDGVTIAKEIGLEDAFANMGAQLVKEVTTKTNDVTSGGATTATVPAQAMINEGVKNITTGSNSIVFRRGMGKACDRTVETVKEMSQPISGRKQIARVATVSVSNDEVGEMVADAMGKATGNGVITVKEPKTMKTEPDLVEGMQFDHGYISVYMANDVGKMEATLKDPYILITDKKVSNIQEVLPLLEEVVKSGTKLLIITKDAEDEALITLIVNKLHDTLNVVTVKAPGYDDRGKKMLQDIAVLTGGTVISEQLGFGLKDARMAQLGRTKSVKVTKESTVIVDGLGKKAGIDARAVRIKAQLAGTSSEFDRERLQEHLAKLSGGIAVIHVGMATETEMKEAKLRMRDTLNATRATVKEGIVADGGTACINASKEVRKLVDNLEGDGKTGVKIVMKALEAPLFYITENAGLEGAVIVNQAREGKKDVGFDAYSEIYADMVKRGILDPAEVTRTVLENATSVASTLLTTESTVATIRESQATPAMPTGGMDGMV